MWNSCKLNRSFLESFLSMSYMYYSVFGSIVTVLVGCIVSLFTHTEGYDATLVHPMVSRFVKSKSELPVIDEKPRQAIINQLSSTEKQREKCWKTTRKKTKICVLCRSVHWNTNILGIALEFLFTMQY